MTQQGRQTAITETQQINEEIGNIQSSLTTIKNTLKKDYGEVKELLSEVQQRDRKRIQDKDVDDAEYRSELHRKFQGIDSRISDLDSGPILSALKEAVSKLIVWQSDITCSFEQQQRSAMTMYQSIRNDCEEAVKLSVDKQVTTNKALSADCNRLKDEFVDLQKVFADHRVSILSCLDKVSTALKETLSDRLKPVDIHLQQTSDNVLDMRRDITAMNDRIGQLTINVSSGVTKVTNDISNLTDKFNEKCSILDDVAEVCHYSSTIFKADSFSRYVSCRRMIETSYCMK
jgi:phage shock protein A